MPGQLSAYSIGIARCGPLQFDECSGVNAALVTAPVFKTGGTSYTDVRWVRFPSAPV